MEHHTYKYRGAAVVALPGWMYQLPTIQYGTVPLAKLGSHHRTILQHNKFK